MARVHHSPDTVMGLGFNFVVEFDGTIKGMFTECTGLGVSVAVEKYEEGGLNTYTHQLPGRATYSNITFKQPIFVAAELYDWLLKIVKGEEARQNLSIFVNDSFGGRVRSWQLKGAFPVKWTGPSLKADANEAAIETLEIAHEGLSEL